jgi:hypothetical protein
LPLVLRELSFSSIRAHKFSNQTSSEIHAQLHSAIPSPGQALPMAVFCVLQRIKPLPFAAPEFLGLVFQA